MSSYIGVKERRGTAAQWTANNPVLLEGQFGFETDTFTLSGGKRIYQAKFGDGVTAWNSLPYFALSAGGGGGGATAFIDLTDVPGAYTGQGGKYLKVTELETGVEFEVIEAADLPTGIDAAKIGDGSVSNTEFQRINSLTSNAQDQLDAKLPTASYTAADVLAKLLTVDGAGSGLDADLLDGQSSAAYEQVTNKATDFGTVNDTKYPTVEAVAEYVASAVSGLLDDRGNYDASVNTFPASGGSGTAGAVLKGDLWTISVAGTLGGSAVEIGDIVRALVDTPGQTASNWAITQNNITYVPENQANKENSTIDTNTTKYPTVNLLKTGLDTKQPLDTELTAFAGLTSAADKLPYFTGSGTMSTADFTALARNLVALAGPSAVRFYKVNADNTVSLRTAAEMLSDIGAQASGSYLVTTNNLSDLANAGTARTNLGATTVGGNIFTVTNPSAVRFIRINADNTVTLRSAADMLADLGGGTGGGQDATKIKMEDEFLRASGSNLPSLIEWTNRSSGSGASAIPSATNEADHSGIVVIRPGTTTSGWGAFSGPDNTDQVEIADGDLTFEIIVKTPTALSDGTDDYTIRFGLNTSNAGLGSNAVVVRYNHSVNSGKWQFVHNRAGVATTIDSGITVATSTWYRLKFTLTGASQEFEGFVNGSSIGSATPANPIAAGNRQGTIFSIAKTAGTTDRPTYIDYVYFEQTVNR